MPGIQRCFFSTLDYLQQRHRHVLELGWSPPGLPTYPHSRDNATTSPRTRDQAPAGTQVTRKSARTPRCPNPHSRPHYSQSPPSDGRPRRPGPPAVPHSALLRLRLQNLHHHNHLICHHYHVLVQQTTPQAGGKASQTGAQTRSHRERPRRRQGPGPCKTRARSHAKTRDRRQAAIQTRRRTTSSARSLTQAQAPAQRQDDNASPNPRGRPLRPPAPAIPDLATAAPSTAPPHRHRRRCHYLHREARRGRGATHLVPPPLKACTPGPRPTPDQTRRVPGSTSSVPAPLPTLDVSPHPANAPLRPPSQDPNPTRRRRPCAGTRGSISAHAPAPHSTPATGLRGLPGPARATSLHDPTTPTHAHSSAQGHGPTHGQWWHRWTHTQL